MGWFNDLLGIGGSGASKDLTFVADVKRPGAAVSAIAPDEIYVELFVNSLRIDKERSFATRFHGIVYCFANLSKQGEEDATFAAVTKPDKLAELDKNSVGKVMTVTKQMLGPVPWRGGNFDLQLGLFSVKSGNVLTPLLNFVTKVSDAAGFSFINVAKPFVPLISEGMDLIAGQTEDTKLVVGVDSSITLGHTMSCAVIAKKKGEIDVGALSIDAADGKLLLNGAPLDAAYCVFSIRATDQKPDWGEIPDLKESYAVLNKALNDGDEDDVQEAFVGFKRKVMTSPDLIRKDAAQLVAKAKELVDALYPPTVPSIERGGVLNAPAVAVIERGGMMVPRDLAALNLYGD